MKVSRPYFSTSPQGAREKFGLGTRLQNGGLKPESGRGLIRWSHDVINFARARYTQAYDLVNRADDLVNRAYDLVNRADDLVNRADDLVNRADDLVAMI